MNTVLFDLDGTLLPMDLHAFIKVYFGSLVKTFSAKGYDGDAILQAVVAGTKAMMKNEGQETNETVFWKSFEQASTWTKEEVLDDFTRFYAEVFPTLNTCTGKNQNMIAAVQLLKQKGYRLLLTTNPMFPKEAVYERLHWAGLSEKDFDMITSYEVCTATKPNVKYYEEVIAKEKLEISSCMMVGNDAIEDGVIETLGIPLYLVEDDLINPTGKPLTSKWHGSSEAFLQFVKSLEEAK